MTQSTAYAAHSPVADAAGGLIGRLRRALSDYRHYSSTVAELQLLSDRELADLGIHRSSISDIAHKSVYGG